MIKKGIAVIHEAIMIEVLVMNIQEEDIITKEIMSNLRLLKKLLKKKL
jgi:hypothetical protein